MHEPYDKSGSALQPAPNQKNGKRSSISLARARRRAGHAKKLLKRASPELAARNNMTEAGQPESALQKGYDPEFLYVECGRCGSPVLWEEGRASRLLMEAGVDPLELDSSCILLTDGCPACGATREYSVRIFRLSDQGATHIAPLHGHA